MQETTIACVLAFLSASTITYFNVYSSEKFHNYFFLLNKNAAVIFYSFLYGSLGIGLYFLLKDNVIAIASNHTKVSRYLYPIAIGIATKGICDLNFFNIKADGFSIPIGLRTITQPLDKFLEEKFDGICFIKSKRYLDPYFQLYQAKFTMDYGSDLKKFKEYAINGLKNHHPDIKKVSTFSANNQFIAANTSDEILVLVLREFGPSVFGSIFPK